MKKEDVRRNAMEFSISEYLGFTDEEIVKRVEDRGDELDEQTVEC